MPKRITRDQREAVLAMLAQGYDRDTIAAMIGVTPGQVSAISAHVSMGTYRLPDPAEMSSHDSSSPAQSETKAPTLRQTPRAGGKSQSKFPPVLLGTDAETGEPVHWNPDPDTGSANPHVLILGESGFGKTYTVCCLLAELSERRIHSIVFDYGQGFSHDAAPKEFIDWASPVEILASRDGIDINPLQIFPTDILGPINVAQRVADTFSRVYTKIGVQQHAVLRQAVLDVFSHAGILADDRQTWDRELPLFRAIQERLEAIAADPSNAQNSVAATVASHVSTMFVFNTFRRGGRRMAWREMLASDKRVFVLQLKGLARIIREFENS